MSRGPGRWQRYILDAVEKHGAVWLHDLLPPLTPRARYVALNRAALLLFDAGRVDFHYRVAPLDYVRETGKYVGGYRRRVLTLPGKKPPTGRMTPRILFCDFGKVVVHNPETGSYKPWQVKC